MAKPKEKARRKLTGSPAKVNLWTGEPPEHKREKVRKAKQAKLKRG